MAAKFSAVADTHTRETFGIAACTECGLGETYPQPVELGRFYDGYHGGRHSFTAAYCVRRHLRFLRQIAGVAQGRRLLDVGCGDGAFLVAAGRQGWRVAGTEMGQTVLRAKGLKVWEDLAQASELAPYDCVTLWNSLEHMTAPRGVIQQASALLAPGGTMLVAVPNAEGFQASVFGSKWFHLDVPRHLFHFGPRSLARILEGAGLRVTRTFHLEAEIDVFGWTQGALNLVFREPNIFFHQLTGKPTDAGRISKAVNFAAGVLLTGLALPLTAAGYLGGKGAILVMAARRDDRSVSTIERTV
jgi:SAM-dependent methyltransferase